jgi:hypothetical protein
MVRKTGGCSQSPEEMVALVNGLDMRVLNKADKGAVVDFQI